MKRMAWLFVLAALVLVAGAASSLARGGGHAAFAGPAVIGSSGGKITVNGVPVSMSAPAVSLRIATGGSLLFDRVVRVSGSGAVLTGSGVVVRSAIARPVILAPSVPQAAILQPVIARPVIVPGSSAAAISAGIAEGGAIAPVPRIIEVEVGG